MAPRVVHVVHVFGGWIFYLFLLSTLTAATRAGDAESGKRRIEIDVKPGGVIHTYEESLGDIKCKFTFSCQGGTNEKWDMVITRTPDNQFAGCTVERPSGKSYLFFQTFKMEMEGAHIQDVSAYADSGTVLRPDEIKLDKKSNSVTQVDGKFNSQLAKLEVYGPLQDKKSEL